MTLPSRSVCLYVDGAQNPASLDRGIGRQVSEHASAIHALAPSVLHSVLLNPERSLTGNLSSFLGSGLLGWNPRSGPADRLPTDLPRVYHIMSPFEPTPPDAMWPRWARDSRIATVVTLHDLIPLIFADQYLRDVSVRAWYMARLELIRHADVVLSVSEYTAQDAVEHLQIPAERVQVIHAGTSDHFADMYPSAAAAWAQLSRQFKGVRPGFMLYVGALEFRKNIGGLIAGFARLPAALRAQHQLVIVCAINPDQRKRLEAEASGMGVGRDQLVLTGRVTDPDLGALYRACTLFVYPSLYEGFGLPIIEAMSSGAPVAASATTTGPEVLGDLEGTFDPHDPDSIASCLAGILNSPDAIDRLRARSRRRVAEYTWRRVAERSIEGYERAVGMTARRSCRRARRLALVTSWPPDRSRIAGYNLQLAAELGQCVDVDVIVGNPAEVCPTAAELGVRVMGVRDFEQVSALRQHDRVLYCMGNSTDHAHVYELLKHRPGAIVLHDVMMADFYFSYAGVTWSDDPRPTLAERIQEMYGPRLPPDATDGGTLTFERQMSLGIYMTRELQILAEQCFVHSKAAREVLEYDRGALDPHVRISVVPFAIPEAVAAPRGHVSSSPLVVSLSDVNEVNDIATLINAFGQLAIDLPDARLVIAGPIHGEDLDRWHRYATEHAPHANIDLLGDGGADRYADLLRTADLAAELRVMSTGDASTAVADCLASGVPTIVTDLGWARELPGDVAEKVSPGARPQQLKDRIARLLADGDRRLAMSRAALEYARRHSFARVAAEYLDALGLP
jgi:glycosyltransferase involved in cell wall biosynthesis